MAPSAESDTSAPRCDEARDEARLRGEEEEAWDEAAGEAAAGEA